MPTEFTTRKEIIDYRLKEAGWNVLRTVIERCLSKNVIERYQGFGEIACELRAIRALTSTVAPPRRYSFLN
jgi:hypothetical protein